MNFLISVILPVYNGEKYISDAIQSILNQTYSNFELIIVNDCSTDNTLVIISEYAKQDSRIKIITNPINKKLPVSLNVGHRLANGDFITWTSDDNLYKSNAFETYLSHLINFNSDIVYSDFDLINDTGIVLKTRNLSHPENLINGNVIGASFLYKREVFEVLNGYNESLFLVEDYDFWMRAFVRFKFYYISKSLYFYRSHGDSLSSQISRVEEKNTLWKNNLVQMFNVFFAHYTKKIDFFTNIFTKHITHQSILLSDLLDSKKDLIQLIKSLETNKLLEKERIRIALKDKLIHLLVTNPQKKYIYKLSIFIMFHFWDVMRRNDIKTMIKYIILK